MIAQDLIHAFETLAEAPDGVTRLRELVLGLAVRGKLVHQVPDDEPASVLLDRIAQEKARLVREKKIRKPKKLPSVSEDEVPFEVPEGWVWAYLQDIGDWGAGATPRRGDSRYFGGSNNWFKSGELPDGPMRRPSAEQITEVALAECSLRQNEPGDVLIAMYGATIGKLGILDVAGTTNQAVCACTCHDGFFNKYLFLFLRASRPHFVGRGEGGAQPNISKVKIVSTPVPCPPLPEQHRIVERVDQLMGLLDRLEAARNARESTRAALRDAALAALSDADTPDEVQKAWGCIAENIHDLFTDPADVKPLRQAVLQLAVRGRLVPQDPEDEPASVLLERIAEEKARLVKEKKIRKPKVLPPIDEDEVPFEVPEGWVWTRFAHTSALITKGSSPKWQGISYVDPPTGILFVTSENVGANKLLLHKRKHVEARFNEVEPRSLLRPGDLLLNIVGASIGRCCIYDADEVANINQAVCVIRSLVDQFDGTVRYLAVLLNSELAIRQMFAKQVDMARANLSLGSVSAFQVPVPPVQEQHRIVERVDQLMDLLDRLEAALAGQATSHEVFAAAAVHHLDA